MKRLLKCTKGMTMIELVAGMMIFTVLAVSVSAILVPMLKVFVQANELAECNVLLDTLANEMVNDLSAATAPLDMPPDTPPPPDSMSIKTGVTTIDYSVDDGVLQKGGTAVLAKDYYKNKTVSFSCKLEDSAYILTVTVYSKTGSEMLSRDYAVRPLSLI